MDEAKLGSWIRTEIEYVAQQKALQGCDNMPLHSDAWR